MAPLNTVYLLAEGLKGQVHPLFDGLYTYAFQFGNLGIGLAVDAVQQEGGPLVVRQVCQGVLQFFFELLLF